MFLRFDELFGKQMQKLPHFVKKHENSWICPKICNFFEKTTMFGCFDELLSKRLQKVAQFVKKHEKSSIWPKLCNFSNKLLCLCISINFSGKSCQKCLISCLVSKKHEKSSIWPKLATFRKVANYLKNHRCFGISMNFSAKRKQKVPHFVKKHEKSSIWPKLEQTTIFGISMKAKSKKCLISWTSTKNHRFCENSQLFQQTTMFWRFGELFSEKLQKVPRFLRKL